MLWHTNTECYVLLHCNVLQMLVLFEMSLKTETVAADQHIVVRLIQDSQWSIQVHASHTFINTA